MGESEWEVECAAEWLRDEYPASFAALASGWCWPDGELVPAPFGSSCVDCGVRVEFRHLWCGPCDEKRIAKLNRQFAEISATLSVSSYA